MATFVLLFNLHAQAQKKPNILVIVSDDQGYADIQMTDKIIKGVSTPNLFSLSKTGWVFTNAYTSGNICAPTRAGLMTGMYQQRNGIYNGGSGDLGMPNEVPFIPKYLGDDYYKAAFGKWHSGTVIEKHAPVNKGFDEYFGYFAKGGHDYFLLENEEKRNVNPDLSRCVEKEEKAYTWAIMRNNKKLENEKFHNATKYDAINNDLDFCDIDGENYKKGVYMTRLLSFEALEFIKKSVNDRSKPFFCYLAYTALHSPLQAPEFSRGVVKKRLGYTNTTLTDKQEDRVTYLAMLDILDEGVGNIIEFLKAKNVYDDTLIIYLTDNGGDEGMQADNGIYKGFKQTNYEGGIRTPFILSWPNIPKKYSANIDKKTIETRISSLDVLPTILDAVGLNHEKQLETDMSFDGKSILPLLDGKTEVYSHHPTMYWSEGAEKFDRFYNKELDDNGNPYKPLGEFAIINNNLKLFSKVNSKTQEIEFELYDIEKDPKENKVISTQVTSPKVKELLEMYEKWLAKMGDPIRKINGKSFYPPITENVGLVTYDEIYYKGVKTEYSANEMNNLGKNIIKSLVVKKGYRIKLFSDIKYDGDIKIVSGNGIPLFLNDFRVKSYEILLKPQSGLSEQNTIGQTIEGPICKIELVNTKLGEDPRKNPERLIDNNYTNKTGKFIGSSKNKPTEVLFEFCEPTDLDGIGISFKNGLSHEVTAYTSNTGKKPTNFIKVNKKPFTNEPNIETITKFNFTSQDVKYLKLSFSSYEDKEGQKVQVRPEILEVEINYGKSVITAGVTSTIRDPNATVSSGLKIFKSKNKKNQINIIDKKKSFNKVEVFRGKTLMSVKKMKKSDNKTSIRNLELDPQESYIVIVYYDDETEDRTQIIIK